MHVFTVRGSEVPVLILSASHLSPFDLHAGIIPERGVDWFEVLFSGRAEGTGCLFLVCTEIAA